MARVEIPAPADILIDASGNVLAGRTVTVKLAGTATVATHYSALTGGTSTTGGLVTHTDGTVVNGSGARRYVDSGQALDITIGGLTRQVEPISASVESNVAKLNVGTNPTNRYRPRWKTSQSTAEWQEPEVVDLRDYDTIRPWLTSLGFVMTSGLPTVTNTAVPFTSADAGKTLIANKNAGGRFMSTIQSVDGSGVATLTDNAPSTTTNQRVQWGFDITTALNAALADFAVASAYTRSLRLPGWYRAQYISIPNGIELVGTGWGYSYPTVGAPAEFLKLGTVLQQLPSGNRDFVVCQTLFTDAGGRPFTGPFHLKNLTLVGPEVDVTGYTINSGSGFAAKTSGGTAQSTQDGFVLEDVHAIHFYEDGFEFPYGGIPLPLKGCRAFYNKGYGFNFYHPSHAAGNSQAVHLLDCSGDGNALGLAHFKDFRSWASIVLTNLKSEKGNVNPNPSGQATWQENAVIFEDCEDTPVAINGLSHISAYPDGTHLEAPGPAIVVSSATDYRPKISFGGLGVRLFGDETTNVANAVTLRDSVISVDLPLRQHGGVWPPDTGALDPDRLGIESFPRKSAISGGITLTSGNARLMFFTADETKTVTTAKVWTGATAAAATPTHVRYGLFEVLANGDVKCVAVTTDDTSLLAAINTGYSKALTASYKILAGKRYAASVLIVTGAATPVIEGINAGIAVVNLTLPYETAFIAGLADHPAVGATTALASLVGSSLAPYVVFS